MKDKIILTMLVALIGLTVTALGEDMEPQGNAEKACINASEVELSQEMRMLWEEHIVWTRMFIISVAENLNDTNVTTQRLLQNYDDMEESFLPFYGDEISKEYGELLEDHLLIAAAFVKAAKAGNSTAAADAEERWYENADEIATFMNTTNPHWDLDEAMTMWRSHLDLTKQEAVARLTGNYTADVEAYDMIHEQAMKMADMTAEGIVEQFPEKFAGC